MRAFVAGAMLYVVVEELVPEYSSGMHSNIGTIGFTLGFAMMMALDVVFYLIHLISDEGSGVVSEVERKAQLILFDIAGEIGYRVLGVLPAQRQRYATFADEQDFVVGSLQLDVRDGYVYINRHLGYEADLIYGD